MENLPSMGPAGDQHMQQGAMTTLERIHKGLPSPSAIKPEQPAATEAAPAKEKGDERNSDRSRAGLPDDSRPQLLLPGPGGSGEANQALAREAARAVLADALGRLLTKEAHAVERAAKGNRFDQWVGTFYPKHKGEVAAALKPAAHAAAAAGISLDVTEQADEICRQSRQDLSAAYSADTPQQFAERLAKWSERAAGIVERILGNA
jgi:hypothetical protein